MRRCVLFNSNDLLPAAWEFMQEGPLWAFNPGLLKCRDGWIFAYRLVGADQLRRIGLCRLNSNFQVVKGSQVPFSDWIKLGGKEGEASFRSWFADPRIYRLAGRTFLYWNSGWHEPRNAQFLQEFDEQSLTPIGVARELVLNGARQSLEKNWSIFGDGPFYAVYSIAPHRILEFSLAGEGDLEFKDLVSTDWDTLNYSSRYGSLRGGAPPIKLDGLFYSFCHSQYFVEESLHYVPAVYCFGPAPAFQPTHAPKSPLKLGNPFGAQTFQKRLNPVVGEVIYPCGACLEEGHLIVSYGINDEHCAISVIPIEDANAQLEKLAR